MLCVALVVIGYKHLLSVGRFDGNLCRLLIDMGANRILPSHPSTRTGKEIQVRLANRETKALKTAIVDLQVQ